jgi:photosystem II stability/assembly factor-like uncharacterized protein
MKKIIFLVFIIIICNSCRKRITLGFDTLSLQAAYALNSIAVWNNDTIAVCGGSRYLEGDIYISYDGGATWKAHEKVIDKALYKICFADAQHLYATGYDGKLMISSDYGQTWQYNQLDYLPLNDIRIISKTQMVICGGGGYRTGIVYRLLTDGTIIQRDTFVNEFRSVTFLDSLHGYCCGYGLIMKTDNGGETWTNTSARGDFFKSIQYDSDRNIYALGMTGTLIYSPDNGNNWKNQISGDGIFQTDISLNSLLVASNYSIMCGNNGRVLYKGSKWEKVKSAPDVNLTAIAIVNDQAWMTGDDGKIHCMSLP